MTLQDFVALTARVSLCLPPGLSLPRGTGPAGLPGFGRSVAPPKPRADRVAVAVRREPLVTDVR
jgi:hypothetical protein